MSKLCRAICLCLLGALVCFAFNDPSADAQTTRKRASSRTKKTKKTPAKSQPTPQPEAPSATSPAISEPAPSTAPAPFVIVPRRVDQPNTPPPVDVKPKRYPLKGKILEIHRELRQATVEHETIPGYMEAMAMKFPLKDAGLADKLQPGDLIEATLVVSQTNGDWWLEDVIVKKK